MKKANKEFRAHPGNFVREWRKFRKLTQEALAARAGLTHGTISQLETGKIDYTQSTIESLARELACMPGDLISYPPMSVPGPRRLATGELVRSLGLTPADLAAFLATELAQDAELPPQSKDTGRLAD